MNVKQAIKNTEEGKAVGPDEVFSETIKLIDEEDLQSLLDL